MLILEVEAATEKAAMGRAGRRPLPRPRKGLVVRGPEVISSAESTSVIRGTSVISESECPWSVIVNVVIFGR